METNEKVFCLIHRNYLGDNVFVGEFVYGDSLYRIVTMDYDALVQLGKTKSSEAMMKLITNSTIYKLEHNVPVFMLHNQKFATEVLSIIAKNL